LEHWNARTRFTRPFSEPSATTRPSCGWSFCGGSGAARRANPRAYWLFYHPQEKFQLRIKGMATLHADDELHEEQWLATELFSRRCYIGADPSQVSDHPTSGLPENLINGKPSPEESEAGKANFVVVTSSIEEIDCYELNVKGHRRSLFTWHENGELRTKWLTP
jgi:hypothetical protein